MSACTICPKHELLIASAQKRTQNPFVTPNQPVLSTAGGRLRGQASCAFLTTKSGYKTWGYIPKVPQVSVSLLHVAAKQISLRDCIVNKGGVFRVIFPATLFPINCNGAPMRPLGRLWLRPYGGGSTSDPFKICISIVRALKLPQHATRSIIFSYYYDIAPASISAGLRGSARVQLAGNP